MQTNKQFFGAVVPLAVLVLLQAGHAETPAPRVTKSERGHIVLPVRTDSLPFSDGVLVRNTLYLAGKLGIDPQTGQAHKEVEQEIRLLSAIASYAPFRACPVFRRNPVVPLVSRFTTG